MKYRWRSSNANVDLLQSKRSRTIQMGTWGLITSQGKVQPLLFSQLVNYLAQVECPGFSRTNGLQYLDTVLSSRLPWGTGDNVSNQLLKLQWSMTQIWKKSIGCSILRPSSEAQCWAALAKRQEAWQPLQVRFGHYYFTNDKSGHREMPWLKLDVSRTCGLKNLRLCVADFCIA